MYGVLAGDLAGFPYEYKHVDLTDRGLPLFPESGEPAAGTSFSDKTVLTAAVEKGLVEFEHKLPDLFAGLRQGGEEGGEKISHKTFEETCTELLKEELTRFGRAYPLAGYSMDVSIWLFRDQALLSETPDPGPAARAVPVAWTFQEDLYMMRHLARLQARMTHKDPESVRAADAAACAVFLAVHGCTKDYIAGYLEREFKYRTAGEEEMRGELLQAGEAGPDLCVRAAVTAFLNGRDFEDVLRRAVSLGGRSSEIAAVAGGLAEAFFGMPDRIREACRDRLPADLRAAADEFAARVAQKKEMREKNPRAQAMWDQALTRSSERHPAAVRDNEPLEQAIRVLREKKDQQSLINALELLRLRMNQKGRLFVPLVSAKRVEPGEAGAGGQESRPDNAVAYRMQAIRTKDGKLWQPAYTSRSELDRAAAAQGQAAGASGGMVLSYAMDALLKRFLPAQAVVTGIMEEEPGAEKSGQAPAQKTDPSQTAWEPVPAQIEGLVLNPYGNLLFLPRKTIEGLFMINRESGRIRKDR